jgi:hypothetical protein
MATASLNVFFWPISCLPAPQPHPFEYPTLGNTHLVSHPLDISFAAHLHQSRHGQWMGVQWHSHQRHQWGQRQRRLSHLWPNSRNPAMAMSRLCLPNQREPQELLQQLQMHRSTHQRQRHLVARLRSLFSTNSSALSLSSMALTTFSSMFPFLSLG